MLIHPNLGNPAANVKAEVATRFPTKKRMHARVTQGEDPSIISSSSISINASLTWCLLQVPMYTSLPRYVPFPYSHRRVSARRTVPPAETGRFSVRAGSTRGAAFPGLLCLAPPNIPDILARLASSDPIHRYHAKTPHRPQKISPGLLNLFVYMLACFSGSHSRTHPVEQLEKSDKKSDGQDQIKISSVPADPRCLLVYPRIGVGRRVR